jgi:hypothetical protein
MYRIKLANKLTCVELEQELELERGAVMRITEQYDGTVEVCFTGDPGADRKATLQSVFNKKIVEESGVV